MCSHLSSYVECFALLERTLEMPSQLLLPQLLTVLLNAANAGQSVSGT